MQRLVLFLQNERKFGAKYRTLAWKRKTKTPCGIVKTPRDRKVIDGGDNELDSYDLAEGFIFARHDAKKQRSKPRHFNIPKGL
jgi:hypothetical protein